MSAPHYPPFGLHLPCTSVHAIDGYTVRVTFPASQRQWKIRLIDCWAAELSTEQGQRALQAARDFIEAADAYSVFIPAPRNVVNLLANLTFDRIPGHVFLREDMTLNEAMVLAGYATRTKAA